jgi:hypothetical protein
MTPDEAVRALRLIRYSPKRGRRLGIAWLARQSGYSREALYAVIRREWCSRTMAQRLDVVFKTVSLSNDRIAFTTLGPLDGGRDPRGRYPAGSGKRPRPWPRPAAGAPRADDIAASNSTKALEQGPTNPAIRIEVGRLLTKLLR